MTAITVVGSINMDLLIEVPHLPSPGETVVGSDAVHRPGGKGANQAVAARRLGAEVTLIAAVGDDSFGVDLRATLQAEGVETAHLATTPGTPSGLAFIVVRADGENEIIVAPGANRLLDEDTVGALPEQLARSDSLLLQLEIPLRTNLAAARQARHAGTRTILNAAPLPQLPDPTFHELLEAVDVLVVNEGEAAQLSQHGGPTEAGGWMRVAQTLRELGPPVVVLTLGSQGAVAATESGSFAQRAFPVDTVDGTGAGDAFCGALAVALAAGHSTEDALRNACATGALATSSAGAQAALPTYAEVDQLLAQITVET